MSALRKNRVWLSEHEKAYGANWRKWLGHLKDTPAVGIELGTWMGESAEWMLDNIFTHPEARYTCVDTFEGSDEHRLAGIDCSLIEQDTRDRLERFGAKVTITKAYSNHHTHKGPFDFVYVDAAHDALNVLRDAVLHFENLKVGGIMVFDDYGWTVMPDAIDCPKLGVDSFVNCYARQVEVIGMGWQLALKRTR